jgi:hypothetical protein
LILIIILSFGAILAYFVDGLAGNVVAASIGVGSFLLAGIAFFRHAGSRCLHCFRSQRLTGRTVGTFLLFDVGFLLVTTTFISEM